MANSRRIHRAWWIFTGDYAPPERTLNLSDRGEFRKFRTRRSRGLEGLFFIGEAWKVYSLLERPGRFILYSPADWSIIFTVCHIRHLILVFTNNHYIKLKIKTIFSTFSSILSEYFFLRIAEAFNEDQSQCCWAFRPVGSFVASGVIPHISRLQLFDIPDMQYKTERTQTVFNEFSKKNSVKHVPLITLVTFKMRILRDIDIYSFDWNPGLWRYLG